MTPFPTSAEIAANQVACAEAWELSLTATGLEKMKLIARAFPHAIERSAPSGRLSIHWHPKFESFVVSDLGGYITMIPLEDTHVLIEAMKTEYHQLGAFREKITGKKAKPVEKAPKKFVRTQKLHISLGDLDL